MNYKRRKLAVLFTLLLLVLFAVGCGRKKTEAPVVETPAPTVAPTATPSPAPTPLKPPVVSTTPRPQPKTTVVEDPDGGTMRQVEIQNDDGSTTTINIRNENSTPAPSTAPGGEQSDTEPSPEPSEAPSQELRQLAAEYEWFMALSPQQQYDYSMSFDPYEGFFDWYNAAKAAYDATRDVIVIEDGDVIEIG